jgi:hypothetical protein
VTMFEPELAVPKRHPQLGQCEPGQPSSLRGD